MVQPKLEAEIDYKYVGSEYILTSNDKGLTIKRNDSEHGCGEFFGWDEIKHLLDAPKNTSQNVRLNILEDKMVKRWFIDTSCECGRFGDDVNAWEDKDGEWVRFDDVKHLLSDAQETAHNRLKEQKLKEKLYRDRTCHQ